MAKGDVPRALLDGADALFLARSARVGNVELHQGWRRVNPPLRVHQVREDAEDPVRSWGYGARKVLHYYVRVGPVSFRLFLLALANRVLTPPQREAEVEADPLHHPLARDGVAQSPEPYLPVYPCAVHEHGGLP